MTNTESSRQSATIAVTYPELVHRHVNPDDAEHSAGSNRQVQVWCDGTVQGHPAHARVQYFQKVVSFTSGRNGCPVCVRNAAPTNGVDQVTARKPKPGQSLAELYPDLAGEWDYNSNDRGPAEITAGSKYKARWVCRDCGQQWQAAVDGRTQGRGCPVCARSTNPTNEVNN